ncbi:MAG: hypothetical protein ABI232_01295 [Jatrophihabitantaceae bacterium]
MRVRQLTVALAVLVAAATLTSCSSKVGTAAVVGGHSISDSDVAHYITPAGPDPSAISAAQAQGQTLQPSRVQVLSQLITQKVFRAALADSGSEPSAAEIAAAHDDAVSLIGQSQTIGADYDNAITAQMITYGFTDQFAHVIVQTQELEYLLVKRVNAASATDLLAAINKLNIPVTVSGRYGTWDPSQLALTSSGNAGLPSFVTFASAAAPSPSASAPAN